MMQNKMSVPLTTQGYLSAESPWNQTVAQDIATFNHVTLTAEHWLVLDYLRRFYQEFPTIKIPGLRVIIKLLSEELGEAKGNSIYFYQLFPQGLLQACKIAGLPQPNRCAQHMF